jgi:hypothetical protein
VVVVEVPVVPGAVDVVEVPVVLGMVDVDVPAIVEFVDLTGQVVDVGDVVVFCVVVDMVGVVAAVPVLPATLLPD